MKQKNTTHTDSCKRIISSPRAATFARTFFHFVVVSIFGIFFFCEQGYAQAGTWTPLTNIAPDFNGGVMLLLTDGTVIAKTFTGSTYGTTWDKLTPDSHGSYINGTWSTIAPMHDDRLYFSSQVLKDGRVYVAGGESGSGASKSEIYNPQSNTWTSPLTVPAGAEIYDGNSEILSDGRVLQGIVTGGASGNYFFDPATNTYSTAPSSLGSHDESAWLKLPDNSILFVDIASTNSERYIPSTNTWVHDGNVPVALYDTFDYESGSAFLLPNGKAFFIGSTSNTAIYTPSGTSAPGTWIAGPTIPAGLGAPDASAAMMVNGKILCAFSHTPTFSGDYSSTTIFYEYDYTTNSFTLVGSPTGGTTLAAESYMTDMLDLPDGTILFADQGSRQYYEYIPSGTPIASGKPTVSAVSRINCDTFLITGTLFTGISEGANFGDDWQMASNYPIIRLTSGTNVYYARSFNWNRIGAMMTGTLPDTAQFSLPDGLPSGSYSLALIVNGNPSSNFTFNPSFAISPSNASVALGGTTTLTDPMTGGTWSSSSTSIASVGSSTGIVTGVASGTATITYLSGGCVTTSTVAVTSGTATVCIGATTTLTDATTGGTWTSSNPAIATVTATGIATGVSPGTDTIIHTPLTGSPVSKIVIVNAGPLPITGSSTVCQGSTLSLTESVTGGTWTSSTSAASVNASTGAVTGVSAGTTVITYSTGTCYITRSMTVNPVSTITGGSNVCLGLTLTLSDAISGGTWSSSNTGVATISAAGVVNSETSGSTVVTYTLPTGCSVTNLVIVNATPAPIPTSTNICVGAAMTMTSSPTGGTWISNAPTVASINATTGVVTGMTSGIATITYSIGTGCNTTTSLVINDAPAPISGPSSICTGTTAALTESGAGNWSSSNLALATVSSGGMLAGVSAGVDTLNYTLTSTGCSATTTVTVNNAPSAITGNMTVCAGATTVLSDDASGGTWSSSNTAIVTVAIGSGVVTGISAGSTTIYYSLGNCSVSSLVTVIVAPVAITGTANVCTGSSTTLADATSGGTWAINDVSVATIASGVVTGVSAGSVSISYTIGGGCTTTRIITVNPIPAAITGVTSICAGSTTSLSNSVTGGTWSSSNIAIATVASGTGIVTGVTSGTATINYAIGTCTISTVVTVSAAPAAIGGTATVCTGSTTTLTNATTGGAWSSSNTSVASVVSGTVTGTAAGSATISYAIGSSCIVTKVVTVNPLPAAIGGTLAACVGSTTTLTDGTASGTWSSSNTAIATVATGSGVVTGISAGSATIYYSLGNCSVSSPVTVIAAPVAITGTASVCTGSSTTLADATSGGTWASNNISVATIASGVVTGVTAGSVSISYTIGGGCTTTRIVTVNSIPAAITGVTTLCAGSTTSLSNSVTGGTWSSSSAAIATVASGTGIVTGVTSGTVTINYAIGTCTISTVVTVSAAPAAIGGTATVCTGATTTLTNATTGGAWTSSNTSVASVVSGTVTGTAAGSAIISYAIGSSCIVTKVVTVNPLPAAIGGTLATCVGSTTTLTDGTASGTWSSSNTAIASVVSTSGATRGVAAGTASITYKLTSGCAALAIVTINAAPAAIAGTATVCAGTNTTLTDGVAGGAWTSSNTAIANVVSATGVVSGVASGTANISYATGSSCIVSKVVTVNAAPAAIAGTASVCAGSKVTLTDATKSGTWSSSSTSIAAVVSSTGVVTGASAGTATISYRLSTGCAATAVVTVNPLPAAISGTATVCTGLTTTLSDATAGGTWLSGTTTKATIASGVTTGVATGTSTISYTLPTGCRVTKIVTVNASPSSIAGTTTICIGSTSTLTDAGGGTWSSSATAIASVVSTTGKVKGIAAGTATISYKLSTGCLSTRVVTIHSCARASANNVCVGSTIILNSDVAGGKWTSDNLTVAVVDETTGAVTGMAAGNAVIAYSVAGGLTSYIPVAVYPVPDPITLKATPSTNIEKGESVTLTAVTNGGDQENTYQWLLNGSPIPGANEDVYTSTNFSDNDLVSLNAVGICGSITVLNTVTFNIGQKGVQPILSAGADVRILPNPNTGSFTIKGTLGVTNDQEVTIEITDMLGRNIYTGHTTTLNGGINEKIQLGSPLANGMYILNLRSANTDNVLHLVIGQ